MDRLICGDVGFGKTEVALRGAFNVAMSGAQVAFIVPTTLLCSQHYENFTKRFKNFPLKVDQISRLTQHLKTIKLLKESIVEKAMWLLGHMRFLTVKLNLKN